MENMSGDPKTMSRMGSVGETLGARGVLTRHVGSPENHEGAT